MKKFLVTQHFDAPSAVVHEAYRVEETWKAFSGLPFVGDPAVKSFRAGDPTEVAMAYHVAIDVPPLASRFIEAEKLSFVELTILHADGSGTFEILPDHYSTLLRASGRIEMVSFEEPRCERLVQGSVDVNLGWSGKLFEAPVEEAIVTGLKRALVAQAAQVPLV